MLVYRPIYILYKPQKDFQEAVPTTMFAAHTSHQYLLRSCARTHKDGRDPHMTGGAQEETSLH
jgi:hypothetical protein